MYKCSGCGAILQDTNKDEIGYTPNILNTLCERCFRIKNYNSYKLVTKDNDDYINILKKINESDDLVILVVDLFNITENLEKIANYINNNILLVLTKRDILPKSCYDEKLKKYFDKYGLNILDKVIISSKKNYNVDELYDKIYQYKTSNKVYVVGYTNSGKSTMINKIITNYSNNDSFITTSSLPSTTIDVIEVRINENLNIIDTPGLLDSGDIINYLDESSIKKIIPTTEIKPITYQVRDKQSIIIDDIARIDIEEKNSVTIYVSNNLKIRRAYKQGKTDMIRKEFLLDEKEDIVIQGLGFIKFTNKSKVVIYVKYDCNVFKRKNLI